MKNRYFIFIALMLASITISAQFVQLGNNIEGKFPGDSAGHSVSISADGHRVAVGSPYSPGNADYGAGQVSIYENNGGNWFQIGDNINGENNSDNAGWSVSLSADGNKVAIGEYRNSTVADDAGQVRILEYNGNDWVVLGNPISGAFADDFFGHSVSLSADGNRVVVGAPVNYNTPTPGHAKVFAFNGTIWEQLGSTIPGETGRDFAGWSVSISADGNRVALGAPQTYATAPNPGFVKVFEFDGNDWIQIGTNIIGSVSGNTTGTSVALSNDGNRVVIGAPQSDVNGMNTGQVQVFSFDGNAWIQLGDDFLGDQQQGYFGDAVSISGDGNRIIIGATRQDGINPSNGIVRIFEWLGNNWVQNGDDINGDGFWDFAGKSVAFADNGKRFAFGMNGSNTPDSTGQVRVYMQPNVYGNVYLDFDENCVQDMNETNLPGINVLINPGNIVLGTNAHGLWGLEELPAGDYSLTVDTPGVWTTACSVTQDFTVVDPNELTAAPSFGLYSTEPCPAPDVSVHMPFMRPCFTDQRIYIRACNTINGTTPIQQPYVIVELDPLLSPTTSLIPYQNLGNNQYRFDLWWLYPGDCNNFWVDADLSCDAILGQTLCMQANLFPVDSCALVMQPAPDSTACTLPWDRSSLQVEGYCENDSIYFVINNTGDPVEGDMDCFAPVRVYIDGELMITDSIQLAGGQSVVYSYLGDGRTWRLETDQHPLHLGNSRPNASVENCGDSENWTPGLVNILPLDDADPMVDIFCGVVRGSYDPNDKRGMPLGVSDENKVSPNQKMEYMIRFQNTGTDTAFTVVIRDTLSTDLDIFSVQTGVSSHEYSFKMYGPRVLEWTFNNILLPDSTTNEPESHGFITFAVDQNRDLPEGTELANSAGIYFDYNAPVITNTALHVVDYGLQTVVVNDLPTLQTRSSFQLYPNPTEGFFTVDLKKVYKETRIRVFNVTGQMVAENEYSNMAVIPFALESPAGIYFVQVVTDSEAVEVFSVVKE